jgi:hypothetical protein
MITFKYSIIDRRISVEGERVTVMISLESGKCDRRLLPQAAGVCRQVWLSDFIQGLLFYLTVSTKPVMEH